MWQNAKCYKCNSPIKMGREWGCPYFYCPKCKEDRNDKGKPSDHKAQQQNEKERTE